MSGDPSVGVSPSAIPWYLTTCHLTTCHLTTLACPQNRCHNCAVRCSPPCTDLRPAAGGRRPAAAPGRQPWRPSPLAPATGPAENGGGAGAGGGSSGVGGGENNSAAAVTVAAAGRGGRPSCSCRRRGPPIGQPPPPPPLPISPLSSDGSRRPFPLRSNSGPARRHRGPFTDSDVVAGTGGSDWEDSEAGAGRGPGGARGAVWARVQLGVWVAALAAAGALVRGVRMSRRAPPRSLLSAARPTDQS
jgi:hypothetical protein